MNPIARLRAWYNDPDQFIARAEVAWFRRWFSARGWMWVGLVAFLRTAYLVAFIMYAPAMASRLPWIGSMGISAVLSLVPLAIVASLADRRSLAPFRPGFVEELRSTPIRPHQLWPALLVAPILMMIIMGVVQIALGFVSRFVVSNISGASNILPTSLNLPILGASDSPANLALGYALQVTVSLINSLAASLAYTAFSVRMVIPRGRIAALLAWMALLWFLVRRVFLSFLQGAFFAIFMWGSGGPSGYAAFQLFFEIIMIVGYAALAGSSMQWLRSQRGFDKALGVEKQA